MLYNIDSIYISKIQRNKIAFTIILFYLFFWYFNISYSYSGENKLETIRDMKDNLSNLNIKNNSLKRETKKAIVKSWELREFFKDDLDEKELSNLKEIFDLYKIYSSRINKTFAKNVTNSENTEKAKNNLLREKAWVYRRLTPYIKTNRLKDFLDFVKSDLIITKEKKDIQEDFYKKNDTLKKKVAIIKEKIIKHKKALDEKLEKIIISKIEEKINKLKNNPNFIKLSDKLKIEAIEKTIKKIEEKINIFKKNPSSLNNKKLELYNIVKLKLIELYNSL